MKTLVICHVSEPALRKKILGMVKNYGLELSRGLFECELNEYELNELKEHLSNLPYKNSDCVRIYPFCAVCEKKCLSFGKCADAPPEQEWVIF